MTARDVPPPLDELLARREWVRRFARTLAKDDASADDLAQDAWVAAVERPPRHAGAPAGWFRRVLIRRAMDVARGTRRRESRENAASRADVAPATDVVVATAESHRRVVEAVMALDEPYRTTVLLRFFEDLPPRDVAARMNVPVETVRSRVRRAVEMLRARLDEEHGGKRAAWLVPLLGDDVARPATRRPRSLRIALVAATCAVFVLGGWVVVTAGARTDVERPPRAIESATSASNVHPRAPAAGAGRRRAEPDAAATPRTVADAVGDADVRAVATAQSADAAARDGELVVHVVDARGDPVAGARVSVRSVRGDELSGATDARGEVRLERSPGTSTSTVLVEEEGADGSAFAPASARVPDGTNDVRVVVERRTWISGRAVFAGGAPVADACVRWIDDASAASMNDAFTDDAGRFKLSVAPDATVTVLLTGGMRRGHARDPGDEPVGEVEGVAAGRSDVLVVAHSAGRGAGLVVRVVTAAGAPVAGVRLAAASLIRGDTVFPAVTDAEGRATFRALPDARLYLDVVHPLKGRFPWEDDGWAAPIGHRLVRPGQSEVTMTFARGRWIRGRLERVDGAPQANCIVNLACTRNAAPFKRAALAAVTDDAGAFSFLAPSDVDGPLFVWATALGVASARRDDVRPGDEGIVLRFATPTTR